MNLVTMNPKTYVEITGVVFMYLLITSPFIMHNLPLSVRASESILVTTSGVMGQAPESKMVFRGVTVGTAEAAAYWGGSGYTAEDYTRFQQWDMNTIIYEDWWEHIEEDELQPYVYNEAYLSRIEQQIQLAHQHGLYSFISVRASYGFYEEPQAWRGWSSYYSYDYVNLNLLDASNLRGRDRLIAVFIMLAQRFPDTGICIAFYPYHAESTDLTQEQTFYETTIPTMYAAVRNVTDEYILFHPLHQGNSGDWFTGLTTGQYSTIEQYDYPFTTDPKLVYGFANHDMADNAAIMDGAEWDYDYERLYSHYQPLIAFMAKYNVSTLCGESTPLQLHTPENSYRPIEQSRLDWLEAHLEYMQRHDIGWCYFTYANPPQWYSPIEADGSNTAVADLLAQYAPTLPS